MHTQKEEPLGDSPAEFKLPPPETPLLRLKQWKSR
jgi:hypothetical protein